MVLGIQSPRRYSYLDSGYAFIESTAPAIPTDSEGDYAGGVHLKSTPQTIVVSEGNLVFNISEEYQDLLAFHQSGQGSTLSPEKSRQWEILMWKYGMTTRDGTTLSEDPSDKPLCDDDGILCNGECYEPCGSPITGRCTSDGVVWEGDPDDCPSGQMPCNGHCSTMCSGSVPKCEPQGLVCYY